MFGSSSTLALSALFSLAAVQLVRADPTPTEPAPGDVMTEGETCNVTWDTDSTGTWTSMDIELMTGSNEDMVHLTTVGTVDATTTGTYSYTCPTVTLHSAVYFYQFTSPASSNVTWTGRFIITDSSGTTVDPPESTTTDGDTVEWGTGALTDATQFTAEPTYVTDATEAIGGATASGSASASVSSSSAASASASSTGSFSVAVSVTGSASKSTSAASTEAATTKAAAASSNASTDSTSGAMMGREVKGALVLTVVAALGGAAALF